MVKKISSWRIKNKWKMSTNINDCKTQKSCLDIFSMCHPHVCVCWQVVHSYLRRKAVPYTFFPCPHFISPLPRYQLMMANIFFFPWPWNSTPLPPPDRREREREREKESEGEKRHHSFSSCPYRTFSYTYTNEVLWDSATPLSSNSIITPI